MRGVKILLVGSGAREDALAHALAADDIELHAAPGNPGIGRVARLHAVDAVDASAVVALARHVEADLVVVGPEAPLVAGVADALRAAGFACFGPDAAAAKLEGSKAFAKEIMASAQVPTAMAHVCTSAVEVESALDAFGAPYVVKDDGLAAGKGVVVTSDRAAALAHAQGCIDSRPDGAVVVEEYLDGPEISLFCLSDGQNVVPLAPAQDFKRIFDNDEGPNTGGMGAYSPLPWVPADLTKQVVDRVATPVVLELARRGTPFVGLLYCGLALTPRGLRVIEFNARFGDPETQVVLARLENELGPVLHAAATGELEGLRLGWSTDAAVTVVIAAQGYPGSVRTGDLIEGIDAAEEIEGVHVLHAGTSLDEEGQLVSAGGRVLSVVALGTDLKQARERAYTAVGTISLAGSQHRSDIALAATT